MASSAQACPVTGSKVTALPPDHPDPSLSDKPCPVTNATTKHHNGVVGQHPAVASTATAKDCPVLSKAEQEQVCPVVGTSATALPPSHPSVTNNGDVCPVTKAKTSDHRGFVHEHPKVSDTASAKDCPVLSPGVSSKPGLFDTKVQASGNAAQLAQCPVTGSQIIYLPPDHPATDSGEVCPVTKATLSHHDGIVTGHPPVPSDASSKDCPVLQRAEDSKVCPVVGTSAKVLPPNHPTSTAAGESCPVTGAKAEHHNNMTAHPSLHQADSAAKCPVTGAVAGHHGNVEATAASSTVAKPVAQCPVTGQFADGSRPVVELPAEIAAEPIQYTLMGIPFSTFTRTIAMGLHELRIPFKQVAVAPHSSEILQYNPFGRLPVLVIGHSGKQLSMFESESIARYLDSGTDRILRFAAEDLVSNQKLEEWIAIVSNYVFPAVEHGVVKPFLADKSANVKKGIESMHSVLEIIETRMAGPYLMGFRTTWCDLFLYPILADLAATPYASEIETYQKLSAWVGRMEKRSTAKATVEGTLGAGAAPP